MDASNIFANRIPKADPLAGNIFASRIPKPEQAEQAETGGYLTETGKGVASGAISATGTAMKGVAVQPEIGRFERAQAEVVQQVMKDMGLEPATPFTKEQSKEFARRVKEGMADFKSEDVTQTTLFRAGQATQDFAKRNFQAAKDFENSWTRMFAEGLGSTAPFALAALVPGGLAAGTSVGSTMSAGEAVERAIKAGASKEQIIQATKYGALPGFTEQLPFDDLLEKVPLGQYGKFITVVMKIGRTALAEGGQEALQQAMQNIIAKYVYKPDQDITEGVAQAAAVGAAVGGTIQTAAAPFAGTEEATQPPPPAPTTDQMVVNDPAFTEDDGTVVPAGDMHGQTVTVIERGENMSRVRTADGTERQIGNFLLEPPAAQAAPPAAIVPPIEAEPTTTPQQPGVAVTPDVVAPAVTQKVGDAAEIPDSPRLTASDRKSPIPNELIDEGKAAVESATGAPSTFTTTMEVDGKRTVVTGNVADLVAKDRVETAALVDRLMAGVSPPVTPPLAPSAGPLAATAEVPATVAPTEAIAAPAPATAETKDVSDDAHPRSEDAESFEDFIAKSKAHFAAREAQAKELADTTKSVRMMSQRDESRRALVGPDMAEPGNFRVTYFDKQGPSGHVVYNTYQQALENALREGYVPGAQKLLPVSQRPAAKGSIAGKKIDDQWTEFSEESGTLGIPRAEMPQVRVMFRPKMLDFLQERGVSRKEESVPANSLKPTQKEFSPEKVKVAEGGERPIIVSSDDHVLDGHHGWMAKREAGENINVIRLDKTAAEVLPLLNEFAGSIDQARPKVKTKTVKEDVAITPTGRDVPVTYALVEADELVASQRDEGGTNPNYPAELQPRDRSRGASDAQIAQIAQNLDPRLLDKNPNASDGAPIIANDGVVESGNGRVLAIRRAYNEGLPTAEAYKAYLAEQGYPVEGMKRPVLVRVRKGELSPLERKAFTREANERTTLAMSATERAMADAAAMSDDLVASYRGGDIDEAGNREFVKGFLKAAVGANEQAAMVSPQGTMSQEAIRRVQGALLAKAYGDPDLVSTLLESPDTNIKAIGGAMMDVAGQWAQMRTQAKAGDISPDVDVTSRLMEAVRLVQRARNEGRHLYEYVNQRDVFSGDTIHQDAEALLRLMFRNTASWTMPTGREKLADALRFYVTESLKTKPGTNMFGEAAPGPAEILAEAKRRQHGEEATQQKLAIGGRPAGKDTGAPSQGRAVEAEPRSQAEGRAGVSREAREAEGIARDIFKIATEARAEQDAWLAKRGLTMEQARALPAKEQQRLQEAWQAREKPSKLKAKVEAVRAKKKAKAKAKLAKAKKPLPEPKFSISAPEAGPTTVEAHQKLQQEALGGRRLDMTPAEKAESERLLKEYDEQGRQENAKQIEAWIASGGDPLDGRGYEKRYGAANEAWHRQRETVRLAPISPERMPDIMSGLAINGYTVDDVKNNTMRDGNMTAWDNVYTKHIDRVLNEASLPHQVVASRITGKKAAAEMRDGGTFTEKGYTSLTTDPAYMKSQFAKWGNNPADLVEVRVVLPKGTKALPIGHLSYLPRENEILVQRGQKFDVSQDGNVLTLTAVVEGQPEATPAPKLTKPAGVTEEEWQVLEAALTTPDIAEAMAAMDAIPATDEQEGYNTERWWANRVYQFGKDKVRGIEEAVPLLVERARNLAAKETGQPKYTPDRDRKAVIVIGPPAAGKSTIANAIAYRMKAAIADVDDAKTVIPEYQGGIGANAVHEESSQLGERVLDRLMVNGDNIVIPKVGHKLDSMNKLRAGLQRFGYTVEFVLMDVDAKTAIGRMLGRFKATGRLINPSYFLTTLGQPQKTYVKAKEAGNFDGYVRVRSNESGLTRVSEATEGAESLSGGERLERDGTIRPGGRDQGRGEAEGARQVLRKPRVKVTAADITPVKGGSVGFILTETFAPKAAQWLKDLRATLDKLGLTDVDLRVWERIFADMKQGVFNVDGQFLRNTIDIAIKSGDPNLTLHHEVVHVMRALGLYSPTELAILLRKSKKEWLDKYGIKTKYADFSEDVQVEEGIAAAYADWIDGTRMDGVIAKSFRKMKTFLKGVYQTLTKHDIRTAEDIFQQMTSGEIGRRARQPAGEGQAAFAKGGKKYPLAPRSEWYGEANYEQTGGKMTSMSPDEFLDQVRPLEIDEVSRENIDDLKRHIQSGKTLDPLTIYASGKEDGRHRAIAAKELGITSVPVIVFGNKPKFAKTEMVDMFEGKREQFVIPGAERISDRQLAEMRAKAPLKPTKEQKDVGGLPLFGDLSDQLPLFALSQPPHTPQQSQAVMQGFINRGQPVDRAIRIPVAMLGGIDQQNRFKPGKRLTDKVGPAGMTGGGIGLTLGAGIGSLGGPLGAAIGGAVGMTAGAYILGSSPWTTNGSFRFFANFAENAKRGLIDGYGLDPEYIETYRKSDLGKAAILRQAQGIMKVLSNAGVGTAEAEVLQQILSGKPVNDAAMTKLSVPIRKAIDDMGAEAVSLGLLSAESFQRNRGAYLHRVYAKNEVDQNTLAGWVSNKMAARRKRIIGDQLKGRGMFWDQTMERLTQDFGAYPAPQQGEKVRVLDRISADGSTVTKRAFWPANRAIPVEFSGNNWVSRGNWEVRQVSKNGKDVTLWRDYTEAERQSMGEIVDARYTIAKTFMLMANDLSTGRFYRDVAAKAEWTQSTEPAAPWKDASEYSQHWNDAEIQWVKVPDTAIPKTGGKKRWGALSGKWVRAEIWRDLNELNIASTPGVWRKLLGQWKLNHTSRHPVVHMNNIMSNLTFMDLADVRMQDLAAGLKAYIKGGKDFQEALDNGAFGSDMVAQEIRKEVLEPILEEITKQQTGAANPFLARAGFLGVFADKLWTGVKKLDNGMLRAYQMEDEVFRMATYMRRRSQGDSPQAAALNARDQFLNYDIRAPWIRAMRNSLFPFISYTYRAVPRLMESIAHRPWKLAKYAAIAYAVNALGYLWDDGDDDEKKERAALRDEEQGHTWLGTPRMLRMPFRDAHGLPVFIDVRRWIPAGDIFDTNQGNSALPIPAPLHFGGPIQLGFEFMLNKKSFDGEEITNELTDTNAEKVAKVADWAWKSWVPPAFWMPNSYYWTKISNALHGATDMQGRPYSVPQAVVSSFGIKVKPLDVDDGIKWHFVEFQKVQLELKKQLRSNAMRLQRGLISQKAHDAEAANLMEKFGNLGQKAGELSEAVSGTPEPVE